MPFEITMPQLSDTMSEGVVVKWNKNDGDKVNSGEEIAEIETDKATMPMESFETGTLIQLAKVGDKVNVGDVIGVLAGAKEDVAELKKKYANGGRTAKAAPKANSSANAEGAQSGGSQAPASLATIEQDSSDEMHEPDDHRDANALDIPARSTGKQSSSDRLRVSPLARRMADEKKIDLHAVSGSGPNGRIVATDVTSFTPAAPEKATGVSKVVTSPAPVLPQRVASGEKQVISLSKMRIAIAENLLASKQNIPHFYETIDIDVEDLSRLRARLNEMLESEKVRLSLGDLIAKGVTIALQRHPALNATFNGSEITRHGDVHLGMAVSVPDGLIVPVLRNINQMGLKEIRQRSVDLVDRARSQRLKQEEMSGATFTVSNLGVYGIREFSAIINPPQVGILAIAAAEKRPVVRGEQIVARTMMSITLSADHRVVDGAVAADFLRTLKSLLEEPGMMLV